VQPFQSIFLRSAKFDLHFLISERGNDHEGMHAISEIEIFFALNLIAQENRDLCLETQIGAVHLELKFPRIPLNLSSKEVFRMAGEGCRQSSGS